MIFLSDIMIPLLIFSIIGYGILNRQNIYEIHRQGKGRLSDGRGIITHTDRAYGGSRDPAGFSFLGTFRAAGTGISCGVFPPELIPVTVVKMFSSSAATGLLLDIYKELQRGFDARGEDGIHLDRQHGDDLYTISVYFMAAGIKKAVTRWWAR